MDRGGGSWEGADGTRWEVTDVIPRAELREAGGLSLSSRGEGGKEPLRSGPVPGPQAINISYHK